LPFSGGDAKPVVDSLEDEATTAADEVRGIFDAVRTKSVINVQFICSQLHM